MIPRSKLTEVLAEVYAIGRKYDLTIANVFHAGDGNLHPLICYDEKVPGIVEKVLKAGSEILAACVRAGGTISGEHGIGIEKMADMNEVFTPDDLAAQRAVHDVLDPQGLVQSREDFPSGRAGGGIEKKAVHDVLDPRDLCNPGKIFPAAARAGA